MGCRVATNARAIATVRRRVSIATTRNGTAIMRPARWMCRRCNRTISRRNCLLARFFFVLQLNLGARRRAHNRKSWSTMLDGSFLIALQACVPHVPCLFCLLSAFGGVFVLGYLRLAPQRCSVVLVDPSPKQRTSFPKEA